MNKVAIDQKAKDYWSTYFKDYGQIWVREIPRRIKAAMITELKASKVEGEVKPFAYNIADDGALSLEAAFIGTIDEKQAHVLATVTFDKKGDVVNKIEVNRIK